MKRVVEFLKRNLIGFVLGSLVCIGIASVAATGILSSDMAYKNEKNSNISNVKDALDDLYTR